MARKRKAEQPKPKEEIKQEESSSEEEVEEEIEEEVEEEVEAGKEEEEEEEDEDEEDAEQSSSSDELSSDEEEEESSEDDDEDDDEATKRQKLRKLLEPLGKDRIIVLLKDAALTDPNILSWITQKAESDPTHRKIFVHGISFDATQDQFRQAFQPFGEIEECTLTIDKTTGRNKGYGFVVYKTRSSTKKALKNPQKMIGSRLASCNLSANGSPLAGNAGEAKSRKIFVGNVGPHISPENLRSFFESFGEIEEGPTGLDPVTKKPRGYAFFVYKSDDGLNNALREPAKYFEGCRLSCRKFLEGQNYNNKNTIVNAAAGSSSSNSNQKQGNVVNVMPLNPVNPVNPAVYGAPNLSSGGVLMQQTPGISLAGNHTVASNFNQPGFGASGVMGAMAGNYGINSISPSVIGSYGFGIQAALQGLGSLRPASSSSPSPAAARGPSVTRMQPYAPRPGY